jgi:hypothetical protein
MAQQETKVEETRCSLQTFERNRYFYGKPMTVSDFEAEQRYLIGKQRYVNRLVHGAGVLCGLQVTTPTGFSAESPTVEVAEGAALDCCGNLIIVSRSSTVEVKGDYDPEAVNYLFIKYAECSKHPVMLAANGSSCEEVCCYNRIQETFEIVASTTEPGGGAAAPAPPGTSTGGGTTPNPETFCRELTERYYQENLKTCPGCDDPLVFLAVLDAKEGAVDEEATKKYRSVVFNNSMLHELLCDHVSDFNNPHLTTARQVRALQSVNGVGNNETRTWVPNIDLRSPDNTLTVTPNVNANRIDLLLGANAVRPAHLHDDLINLLIRPSQTVNVVPNPATKSITLHTKPAASVTSVGRSKVVGASGSYAPEDHAHDLSEGVVDRKHLGADVYANLIQGGGAVKVESDAQAQTIKVSAEMPDVPTPGDALNLVSSVTGTKQVGTSERYAREDHAHDLRINGLSPNQGGEFQLTAGTNVRIEKGAADNALVISAEGGSKTVIASDVFVFENVLPQEVRISDRIPHKLESGTVAVVLGLEGLKSVRMAIGSDFPDATAKFGDITAFFPEAPFLMAEVDYMGKTLQISLKDRREPQQLEGAVKPSGFFRPLSPEGDFNTFEGIEQPVFIEPSDAVNEIVVEPDPRIYIVRWWAIPA